MDSALLCRTRVEWYPCPRLSSLSVQHRTDPQGITWWATSTHISYSVNHKLCVSVWGQHSLFLSADIRTSVHPSVCLIVLCGMTFFSSTNSPTWVAVSHLVLIGSSAGLESATTLLTELEMAAAPFSPLPSLKKTHHCTCHPCWSWSQ